MAASCQLSAAVPCAFLLFWPVQPAAVVVRAARLLPFPLPGATLYMGWTRGDAAPINWPVQPARDSRQSGSQNGAASDVSDPPVTA